MNERRMEPRMLCAELVELMWEDESGRGQRRVANLEDISLRGIGLQTERAIPVGAKIVVRCSTSEFAGTVRYCLYRGTGYFLGIEFIEGLTWSTNEFRPQHLVDPGMVAGKDAESRLEG